MWLSQSNFKANVEKAKMLMCVGCSAEDSKQKAGKRFQTSESPARSPRRRFWGIGEDLVNPKRCLKMTIQPINRPAKTSPSRYREN